MFCYHLYYSRNVSSRCIYLKKIHGSGHPSDLVLCATALIISIEEMEDLMKIVKSLEESRLLIKGISETIKNEIK